MINYINIKIYIKGDVLNITWEEIDEDSFNMIPILIVIIIVMISGGVYFVHNLSRNAEQTAEILENYNKTTENEDED